MPPPAELSRRGLFTVGIARWREQTADRAADRGATPPERGPGAVAADAGPDLWAPVAERIAALTAGAPAPVTALFEPVFAADPGAAIERLIARAGPGGTVAFATWTPIGIVGRLLRLAALAQPPGPRDATPLAWGREEWLRQVLERHGDAPRFWLETLELRFADHAEAAERLLCALPPLATVAGRGPVVDRTRELVARAAVEDPSGVVLTARYLVAVCTVGPAAKD